MTLEEAEESGEPFEAKIIGRVTVEKIINPKTKKEIIGKNEEITKSISEIVAAIFGFLASNNSSTLGKP